MACYAEEERENTDNGKRKEQPHELIISQDGIGGSDCHCVNTCCNSENELGAKTDRIKGLGM